jgi:hypothetical protein
MGLGALPKTGGQETYQQETYHNAVPYPEGDPLGFDKRVANQGPMGSSNPAVQTSQHQLTGDGRYYAPPFGWLSAPFGSFRRTQ